MDDSFGGDAKVARKLQGLLDCAQGKRVDEAWMRNVTVKITRGVREDNWS